MSCKFNKTEYTCKNGILYYEEYDHELSSTHPFYSERVGRCNMVCAAINLLQKIFRYIKGVRNEKE